MMEGEFIIEESFGMKKAIAGGMFLILAEDDDAGLRSAEKAVEAARTVEGVVLPFPGASVVPDRKSDPRNTSSAHRPTTRSVRASGTRLREARFRKKLRAYTRS